MTREQLLSQLNHRLGEGFVDFGAEPAARNEALALCDEQLMEKMLDAGTLTDADIIPAVARRHVFPCWFGAALRLDGVDALLEGLDRYTRPAPALHAFGARVFKVSQDEQGTRLTWLRVTGGELKVKALLSGEADGEPWAEKSEPAATVLRRKIYPDRGHRPGTGVRRDWPDPCKARHRAWGRAGQRCAGAGAGAQLSGAAAGGCGCARRARQAAPAGGGRTPAPCGVERDTGRNSCAADGRGTAGSAAQPVGGAVRAGGILWPGRYFV